MGHLDPDEEHGQGVLDGAHVVELLSGELSEEPHESQHGGQGQKRLEPTEGP